MAPPGALAGFSGSQKPLTGIRQRWRCTAFQGHCRACPTRALLSG